MLIKLQSGYIGWKVIFYFKKFNREREEPILEPTRNEEISQVVQPTISNNTASEKLQQSNAANQAKPVRKVMPRPRSAVGSEVVTLVSLLSSGGSDSEKDEPSKTNDTAAEFSVNVPLSTRPPMLRKIGKTGEYLSYSCKAI